jgi:predicted ATP-grasp superfamily ATP-dependent carboligase
MPRSAVFLVQLSRPSAQTVTVNYATVAGTATAGSDFTSLSGTISFAAGQTSAQVIVPVRDNIPGGEEEQFSLVLSNPNNATLADNTGICVFPKTSLTTQPVVSVNNITVASL